MLLVDDPVAFLHPLPIEELWGVGEITAADAAPARHHDDRRPRAQFPKDVLREAVGDASSAAPARGRVGRDPSPVVERAANKSVGAEETFERDLDDDDDARRRAAASVRPRRVAARSRRRLRARTITVKIRLADFETFTRSATIETPTSDAWTIFQTARGAFGRSGADGAASGCSVSRRAGIVRGPLPEQLTLEPKPRYAEAEQALAKVRERFGGRRSASRGC